MDPVRSIRLPERMDAATLAAVQAEILGCRGADLDLDASAVNRFGGQALQLVLAAFKTWREDGFRMRVCDPSDPVRDAFETLGCAPHIETFKAAA